MVSASGWPLPARWPTSRRLLLADEPTGALDSEGGQEVIELLSRLHGGGQTIVLVTHDAGVASAAERIVRMRDGRIAVDEESEIPVPSSEPEGHEPVTVADEMELEVATGPRWPHRRRSRRLRPLPAAPGRLLRDSRSPASWSACGSGARRERSRSISVAFGLTVVWALVGLVDTMRRGPSGLEVSPFHLWRRSMHSSPWSR